MKRNTRTCAQVSPTPLGRKEGKISAPPLSDLITRYLSARDRTVSPNTLLALKSKLSLISAHFSELRSVNVGTIERFVATRRAEGLKDASIRNDLNALSGLFRYAIRHGYAVTNPIQGMERPSDRDSARMTVVSTEDEMRYFAACPEGDLRDLARMILETAARPNEILTLTAEDVELNAGRLYVRKGKTKSARRPLALTQRAMEVIKRRSSQGILDNSLFPYPAGPKALLVSLNKQHRKVLKAAGLDFRLYSLRHTRLSRLAAQGCPLATLAAIAGHSSLRVITRYLHPQESEIADWLTR